MDPESSTSEICPSDYFGSLPLELILPILDHLPLRDIYSLIKASPGARFYFNGNRHRILRRPINIINDHYVESGLVLLAFHAMRLRSIRAQFHNHTIPQIEEQVRPVLDSIIRLDFNHPTNWWQLTTPVLVGAMNLLPEICDTFLAYRDAAMDLSPEFYDTFSAYRDRRRPMFSEIPRLPLVDIPRENRRAFIDSFLRFDCYRNIFYHSRSYMLTDMDYARRVFLSPFPPAVYNTSFPSFSFSRIIDNFHTNIIFAALRTRPATISFERSRETESSQASQLQPLTLAQMAYYKYNLYLQGFPLLLSLKKLTPQALQEYTVRNICETVRSMPPDDPRCQETMEYRQLLSDWS